MAVSIYGRPGYGLNPGSNREIYRRLRNVATAGRKKKIQAQRDKRQPVNAQRERVIERTRKNPKVPKRPVRGITRVVRQVNRAARAVHVAPPRTSSAIRRPANTRSAAAVPRGGAPAGGGSRAPIRRTPAPRRTVTVRTPGAAAPAAPSAADVTTQSMLNDLYKPSLDELNRQRTEAANTRGIQVTDANSLRDWMAQRQADAQNFLSTQLAASRAVGAGTPNTTLPDAQKAAMDSIGGNPALMKAAGIDSVNAALAAHTEGDAALRQSPELAAQAFSRGLADNNAVLSAIAANRAAGIDASYNSRLSDLNASQADLTNKAAASALSERQSLRQAEQDKLTYQLLAREKMGNLKVAQANAETKRIQVITTAQNAKLSLKLKAEVEQGKATRDEARVELQRHLASQNLSIAKQKLELARFDSQTKRLSATSGDVSKLSNYTAKRYSDALKPYGGQWDAVPRDVQRTMVRNIITGMRGAGGAKLTQEQAISILGGVFGDIPLRDPAFRQMVTALWPR